MCEILPDDFAVPIDIESAVVVSEEEPYKDKYIELHEKLHADINLYPLYGYCFVIEHDDVLAKPRPLFTNWYINYPLADTYHTEWQWNENVPVLFPGPEKEISKIGFGNPVRIINSYLRTIARRFQDTDYRDPYNLRPQKQKKKGRQLYTTKRNLFVCNPSEQIHVKEFDAKVLFPPNYTFPDETKINAPSIKVAEEIVTDFVDQPVLDDTAVAEPVDDTVVNGLAYFGQSQGFDYDSDETFTYFDDGEKCIVGSDTETEFSTDKSDTEVDSSDFEEVPKVCDIGDNYET